MGKMKRISAFVLAIIMTFGLVMPTGVMNTKAYADDPEVVLKFTFNGTQYSMYAGQNGSGTGLSWTCDADGDFKITFTASGTFKVDEGAVTNSSVYVIGGGAGGESASGYATSAPVNGNPQMAKTAGNGGNLAGSGGRGGGGGERVTSSVSVPEGTPITVTVGQGGAGGVSDNPDINGSTATAHAGQGEPGGDSQFGSITAKGGEPNAGGAGGTSDVANQLLGDTGYDTGKAGTNPGDGGGGGCAAFFREDDCGNFGSGFACFLCGYCTTCREDGEGIYKSLLGFYYSNLLYWHASDITVYPHDGGAGNDGGGAGGDPCNYSEYNGSYYNSYMRKTYEHDCPNCSSKHGAGYNGTDGLGGGGGGGSYASRIYELWGVNSTSTGSALPRGLSWPGGKGGAGTVQLSGHAEMHIGSAQLFKTSTNPEISDYGDCYSLAGAVYSVYEAKIEAERNVNPIATLTTDDTGTSNVLRISEGTYYVKETTPPPGFELDENTYEVVIVENELTKLELQDKPLLDPIPIVLRKTDSDTGTGDSSGIASLGGAEFTFKFYPGQYATAAEAEASGSPTRSWTFKTLDNGLIEVNNANCFVSGDELYRNDLNEVTFPLGTIVIQETKAPEHYIIDNTKFVVHITEDGNDSGTLNPYNAPEHPNTLTHGGVSVDKNDSALADPTRPQGDANLGGAVFAIINNNDVDVTVEGETYKPGETVATITTNSAGHAESAADLLPLGKFKIVEQTAPTGYKLNTTWYAEFEITDADRGEIIDVGVMTDDVITGGISVQKTDSVTGLANPQGGASFANAVFEVYNASDEPIVFNGTEYAVDAKVTEMTTDETGKASVTGLPYGRYEVKEKSIPAATGYTVNTTWSGTAEVVGSSTYPTGTNCPETLVIYGGLELLKVDAPRNTAVAEGNATLAGAVFEIININTNAVSVSGKSYANGEVVTTVTTDAKGEASLSAVLPMGTYRVVEKTPSTGYTLNEDWYAEFTISTDGQIAKVDGDAACPETPVMGGISVQKLDSETGTNEGPGGMKLNGAEFTIINRSNTAIVFGGEEIAPYTGTFDRSSTSTDGIVTVITTDDTGLATTGNLDLPYGKYEIIETKAPEGYDINTSWTKTVTIKDNGIIVALDGSNACTDTVKRTDISLTKVDGITGDTMANVAFRVTNLTTGESHIIVTNASGLYDSSAVSHKYKTNANDTAVSSTGEVDESKLNSASGTWFGDASHISDTKGAFTYGRYKFEELSSSANDGYLLETFEMDIDAATALTELGEIKNYMPEEMGTTLIDANSGDHYISEGSTVTLYDTVVIENCKVGREYTLEAVLMEKDTNAPLTDASGNPVTATYTFTATDANMTLTNAVVFTFDSSILTGSNLVAFETLTNGKTSPDEREVYSEHKDIDDESQTCKQMTIGTTAANKNGGKLILADKNVTIVDTVAYNNAIPEKQLTFVAKLVDADTGSFITNDGKDVEVTKTFTPDTASGTLEMEITFDATGLEGKNLVVYEYCYYNDAPIASHTDKSDSGQTVLLPKIGTVASNEPGSTGKAIAAAPDTKVYDLVNYENLTPGGYTMYGELYDVETGNKVIVDGNPVTGSTAFVAASGGKGSVTVEFTFDSTGMEGKTFVIFEYLYEGSGTDGHLVAKDTVLENLPETVYVPEIATTATSEAGTHSSPANKSVTITDTVTYTNLYPGQEYKMEGKLMDKDTGTALLDAAGNEITANTTFTPDSADGSVTLTFTFDASEMAGKTAVAFETLSFKNLAGDYSYLTEHSDIDDEDQSVGFAKIRTTAKGENGTDMILAEDTVKIIDTVAYENLTPGVSYTVSGYLVDKATGEAVKTGLLGAKITGSTTFTPTSPNGTVDVEFTLDGTKFSGKALVVFETLTMTDTKEEIARHEDKDDEDQTVYIPEISTNAKADNDQQVVEAHDDMVITDLVTYTNLVPGREYELTITVMDKETGDIFTDSNGDAVTATKTFKPATADGTVEISATIPGEMVAGKTLVCFETVEYQGKEIAIHADIDSVEQSVYVPSVSTNASDGKGSNEFLADGTVTVVDKVTYTDLKVGETYKISGVLMDKETNAPVTIGGSQVTAEKTFTAKASDGEIELEFTFSADECKDKTFVVFETLALVTASGDETVGSHEDIDDEDQTVYFPEISTNAASVDGLQVINPEGTVTIKDTVHVSNAVIGHEYTFRGTIVDESGNALKSALFTVYSEEVTMTATATDFDVVLTFSLDAEKYELAGNKYTVYEKMFALVDGKEKEVANHEELNDSDQQIWFPEISTNAKVEDGTQIASYDSYDDEITITDVITYSGVQPGVAYTAVGTLMDKASNSPVTSGGSPVTASVTFTPTAESGSIEVEFKVKAEDVKNSQVVVFEELQEKELGVTVALHRDINSEDQTITVPSLSFIYKINGTNGNPVAGVKIHVTDVTAKTGFDVVTGTDGYAWFNTTAGHEYSFKEVECPDEYALNEESYTFRVDADGNQVGSTKLVNWLKGTVVINKVNALTNQPVQGAEVTVFKQQADGSYIEVFKQVTDEYGRIYFYSDDPGAFYYYETKNPSGYYLDTDKHYFNIKTDFTVTGQTTFTNAPLGTITLKKLSTTGDYLQGAVLSIYDSTGTKIGSGKTDEYGRVYFIAPKPGSYYFVEDDAPKGYIRDTEKHYFSIDESLTISGQTSLVNKPDPAPRTGDNMQGGMWIAILAAGATVTGAAAWLLLKRRKDSDA